MHGFLQVASLLGAALVLAAYVALQWCRWPSTGRAYLWCNLLGAAILTVVAVVDRRAGFIVLEASWTGVSLNALIRPRSTPPPDRV